MSKTQEWECEKCGVVHPHSKTKHSLWDEIDWQNCKKLEHNPLCNCGWFEAKERGFIDLKYEPPVPRSTESSIKTLK